ncbi:hypothetical protein [Actinomadura flavalba]|uniref:hypothetical protein n=1 Tax=Actinomadura flavalba TaxID=1120938 RepID=UPI000379F846|nr:hypothetical protein [Actinomadura flavalba]
MSETPQDPSGTTHQFQNFAAQATPDKSGPNVALIVGALVVLAIVAVAAVAIVMAV